MAGRKGRSGGSRSGAGRPPLDDDTHRRRGTFRPERHDPEHPKKARRDIVTTPSELDQRPARPISEILPQSDWNEMLRVPWQELADVLNDGGVPGPYGQPWTALVLIHDVVDAAYDELEDEFSRAEIVTEFRRMIASGSLLAWAREGVALEVAAT